MIELTITEAQLIESGSLLEKEINNETNKIRTKLIDYASLYNDSSSQTCINAIYNTIAIIDILWNTLYKSKHLKPIPAIVYATYIGADYGLDRLLQEGATRGLALPSDTFTPQKIDFLKTYPYPRSDLLRLYSTSLDRFARYGLRELTKEYLDWLKNLAISESKSLPEFESLQTQIKGKIGNNYSFCGLSSTKTQQKKPDGKYRWENFGGYYDAVNYFKDLVKIIKDLDYCLKLGTLSLETLLPKGTLLVGPPGTGKTTLALTFCQEANIPFIEFSCSDVGVSLVNETARNIQRKFDEAAMVIKTEQNSISLLFIDELDSIGKIRSTHTNGHNEDDKMVTTLTENMDGYKAVDGVIVLGATNRPDVLDPALVRSGRFGKQVYLDYPTKEELREIFEIYLKNQSDISDINIERIIENTEMQNWTGASVKDIVVRAKRTKLLQHLDNRNLPYVINTNNILAELQAN